MHVLHSPAISDHSAVEPGNITTWGALGLWVTWTPQLGDLSGFPRLQYLEFRDCYVALAPCVGTHLPAMLQRLFFSRRCLMPHAAGVACWLCTGSSRPMGARAFLTLAQAQ
jgi:hypothetical protein